MIFGSDSQRIEGWRVALVALRAHPWRTLTLGWGPETFPLAYRLYRSQAAVEFLGAGRIADHAHNLPLELLVTIGAVGTAAVVYLLWTLWEHADTPARAAMVGLLLVSMVEPIAWPAWGLLFLILGAHHDGPFDISISALDATRVATVLCAIFATALWVSDFATFQAERSALRGFTHESAKWARLASAVGASPTPQDIRVQLVAGREIRQLVYDAHPNEADSNELAAIECLSHGDTQDARVYAQRAVDEDPLNPTLRDHLAEIK